MKRLPFLFAIVLQAVLNAPQAHADSQCPVKDLEKDYESVYGRTEEKPNFMIKEIQLNPMVPIALFVAEELSCGSQGCEYVAYQTLTNKCFKRIGSFVGHFTLLKSSHFGFRDIKVGTKTYVFDSVQKIYLENAR